MYSRINIAFFINNLANGGAERQFIELIRGIDKSQFNVTVYIYACQKEIFYKEIFDIKEIKIITNKLKFNNKILKIVEALFYLKSRISENQYDIYFSTLSMNNVLLRLATSFKNSSKTIVSIRTAINNYSWYLKLFEKCWISISTIVFNNEKAATEFKEILHKRYHNRLFVIPNGYHIPDETIFLSDSSYIIGCLGRLSHQKNFTQLIRAFIKMSENSSEQTELIIQGAEDDAFVEIKGLIDESNLLTRIHIKNPSPNVNEFYNQISIFVLPSIFEGCPNVLFEALLMKKLCIISKNANSDLYIKDGETGFVYDGTDEGLIIALKKAIESIKSQNARQIIDRGYQYAVSNFSMQSMVEKYQGLFRQIVEKHKI